MSSFQEAISSAVKTQAARRGIQGKHIAASLGISRESYWRRVSNKTLWNSEDFERLSSALGLTSQWELIDLAKQEAQFSSASSQVRAA